MKNGQELYEKLKNMTEKERKETLYDAVADKGTLKSILETSVAEDIVLDWNEDEEITTEDVEKVFDDLAPEEISEIIRKAWECVVDGFFDHRYWEDLVSEMTTCLNETLTDKLREAKAK